jgi:Pyruvate/2-oxoacid:ferredoxin oxidoreductase delta subunit
LRLYRKGHTDLVVAQGDCDDCPRGNAPRIESLLQHVNHMLESRQLPPLRLQSVRPKQWEALLEKMPPEPRGPELSRRAFLGHAIKGGITEGIRLAGFAESRQHEFLPPGELLSGGSAGCSMPNVPFMEVERCDGCDACVNLCPHEAIKLSDIGEDPLHYRIRASQCTGCRVCVDVCEQHAISLAHWISSHQNSVSLRKARCRRCGAPYHMPDRHNNETDLCCICTRVDHYGNLYQVLE